MNEDSISECAENASAAEESPASAAQTTGTEAVAPPSVRSTAEEDASAHKLSAAPRADSDPHPDATASSGGENGIDALRGELNALRAMIEAQNERTARIDREYGEFRELYPDVPLTSLTDAIWQTVEGGVPLAAAYALAERRASLQRARAEIENERNRGRASGSLSAAPDGELSPGEVRAMSAAEVRKNFSRIMRSMQKWRS